MSEFNWTSIVGKKIASVGIMTAAKTEYEGFRQSPIVIVLDDGSQIYALSDEEGNDAGALLLTLPNGKEYVF